MKTRDNSIDIIKALAIISVIILHSLSVQSRNDILGPLHVYQAVPIFMILVGYNNTTSYINKNINTWNECYKFTNIAGKLERIVRPFIFIWLLEMIIIFTRKVPITWKELLKTFIKGGFGPGSYFIVIMIEVIFIFPLFYKLALRNKNLLLLLTFIINVIFEIYVFKTGIGNELYKVIFIRFLFAIGLGIYLALGKPNKFLLVIGTIFSLAYIISVHYYGFTPPVQLDWESQNVYSFFWPLALVIVSMKIFPKSSTTKFGEFLCTIGKASFNIFLIQKVYFWLLSDLFKIDSTIFIKSLLNICICTFIGVIFYFIEHDILKYIRNNYKYN